MTNSASVSIIKAFSLEGGSISHCRNMCSNSSVFTVLREVHLIHSTNSEVSLGPFTSLGVNGDVYHVYSDPIKGAWSLMKAKTHNTLREAGTSRQTAKGRGGWEKRKQEGENRLREQ